MLGYNVLALLAAAGRSGGGGSMRQHTSRRLVFCFAVLSPSKHLQVAGPANTFKSPRCPDQRRPPNHPSEATRPKATRYAPRAWPGSGLAWLCVGTEPCAPAAATAAGHGDPSRRRRQRQCAGAQQRKQQQQQQQWQQLWLGWPGAHAGSSSSSFWRSIAGGCRQ